jgi:YfiR/HmsC-like
LATARTPGGGSVRQRRRARKSLIIQILCRFLLLSICLHVAFSSTRVRAQASIPEYTAKAGFLALFPDYVKWTASTGGPMSIGILGDDSFGSAMDKLKPKRSKRVEDLKGCQMIFISKSEQPRLEAILASLDGTNILTVGETEGFAKKGGAIGFVVEGDKVRFEINPGAARRAGLGFDLRLLRLAARVVNSND